MQVATFVITVLIEREKITGFAVSVFFQILDDCKAVAAQNVGTFLVEHAFRDLCQGLNDILGRSVSGYRYDVEGVHAAANSAGCFNGTLIKHNDTAVRIRFLRLDCRKCASAATAHNDDVCFHFYNAHIALLKE